MRDKSTCVLCGTKDAVTNDHLPPKTIFPKPRPSNLITVPSCDQCNSGSSQDDEYFRLMLSTRLDITTVPKNAQIFDAVGRGLVRDESTGFRQTVFESMQDVEVVTKSGIYVKQGILVKPDARRLERVVERIVRGLYWKHYGTALPPDKAVKVYMDIGFQELPEDAAKRFLEFALKLMESQPVIIEPNVFGFWTQSVQGRDWTTVWLLGFYGKIWFFVVTDPAIDVKKQAVDKCQ